MKQHCWLNNFLLHILLLPSFAAAAQTSQQPAILQQLSSEDVAVRVAAVQQLSTIKIAELDPPLAISAVLVAVKDDNPKIRAMALGGLGVLTSTLSAGPEGSPTSYPARALAAVKSASTLRPALERLVDQDPDLRMVNLAAQSLVAAYGSDPAVKTLLLDRADGIKSPIDRASLMMHVATGGVHSATTVERLVGYLDSAPVAVQHRAAEILVWTDHIPPNRIDSFLRIIQTPQYFADPTLVRALPRFGAPPTSYRRTLIDLQSRLADEIKKPPAERTVVIYNDAFVAQVLKETIEQAQR